MDPRPAAPFRHSFLPPARRQERLEGTAADGGGAGYCGRRLPAVPAGHGASGQVRYCVGGALGTAGDAFLRYLLGMVRVGRCDTVWAGAAAPPQGMALLGKRSEGAWAGARDVLWLRRDAAGWAAGWAELLRAAIAAATFEPGACWSAAAWPALGGRWLPTPTRRRRPLPLTPRRPQGAAASGA